jgi:glycolate oxidase
VNERLSADLARALGAGAVVADPASVEASGADFVTQRGHPAALVRPSSPEQVLALLALAAERGIPVAPRAAGTNLCGGFVPGPDSVVVDLTAMDRILEVDADGGFAVVEPGVLNGALQERLAPAGLCFSPDPASRPISTIGGNVACNAGGPGCIKYGVTFHHVAGLDVALSGGTSLRVSEDDPVDLLGVLVGSEGILGIVTRATLRLRRLPLAGWTALAAFDRIEDAALMVSAIIAAGILPAALELADRRQIELIESFRPSGYPRDAEAVLIAEVDGTPEEVAAQAPALEEVLRHFDPAVRIASSAAERRALWAGRLDAAHALRASGKAFYVCDVTVPRQAIPELIARARSSAARHALDCPILAHAGDGNVHPVILYAPQEMRAMAAGADEIVEAALDLGGTITGEHGVGADKIRHMRRRFGAAEIAAFRAVKRAFDPAGILNPRVLLPPPAPDEPPLPVFESAVRGAIAGRALPPEAGAGTQDGIVVDPENLTVEVGDSVACEEVVAALARAGLSCPAVERGGTIGEGVAVSGNRGGLRRSLLAVECSLPDGSGVRFGSAAVKDVAGLDLKRLAAGGRGAFGRIERATLRVLPGAPS